MKARLLWPEHIMLWHGKTYSLRCQFGQGLPPLWRRVKTVGDIFSQHCQQTGWQVCIHGAICVHRAACMQTTRSELQQIDTMHLTHFSLASRDRDHTSGHPAATWMRGKPSCRPARPPASCPSSVPLAACAADTTARRRACAGPLASPMGSTRGCMRSSSAASKPACWPSLQQASLKHALWQDTSSARMELQPQHTPCMAPLTVALQSALAQHRRHSTAQCLTLQGAPARPCHRLCPAMHARSAGQSPGPGSQGHQQLPANWCCWPDRPRPCTR